MYDLKPYQILSNNNSVLVYQMGKVGSSSISKSLEKIGIQASHIHSLYNNRGYELFNKFLLAKKYYPIHKKVLFYIFYLYHRLILRRRRNLKIITLVRDPVGVNISSFFHNLSYSAYEFEQKKVKNLEEAFFDKFNHDYALDWFDIEFLPVTGLDIYKHEFNKDAGFSIIRENNIECLAIKLEKLNDLEKVIAEFVGNDKFKLLNHNISADKWFNPVYQDFKHNTTFRQDYLNRIYSSKLAKHFYSDKEISKFKKRHLSSGATSE